MTTLLKQKKTMLKELKKFPKNLKFNKNKRGTLKQIDHNLKKIKNNEVIIKTYSAGFLNWKIINISINILKKHLKKNKAKKNKLKININLNWGISKKPKGVRMGKGKGKINTENWCSRIKANTILFNIQNVDKPVFIAKAKQILKILPLTCFFL